MSGDWCQADKDRLCLRPAWGSSSLGLDWPLEVGEAGKSALSAVH